MILIRILFDYGTSNDESGTLRHDGT
jgi:hypothetical protein